MVEWSFLFAPNVWSVMAVEVIWWRFLSMVVSIVRYEMIQQLHHTNRLMNNFCFCIVFVSYDSVSESHESIWIVAFMGTNVTHNGTSHGYDSCSRDTCGGVRLSRWRLLQWPLLPWCLSLPRTTMREKLTDLATAATTRTTSTYVTVAQPRSKVLWICKTGTLGFLVGGNWACFNVNFSPFCLKPFKTQ